MRFPSQPFDPKKFQQAMIGNKARQQSLKRAKKDPGKAFGALGKLAKKMNPQQLQQLQQGMSRIMGQNIGGLGAAGQAANAFGNFTSDQQMQDMFKQMPSIGLGGDGPMSAGGLTPGMLQNSQGVKGMQIQQLLANMGLTGPGSGTQAQGGYRPQPGVTGGPTPPTPGQSLQDIAKQQAMDRISRLKDRDVKKGGPDLDASQLKELEKQAFNMRNDPERNQNKEELFRKQFGRPTNPQQTQEMKNIFQKMSGMPKSELKNYMESLRNDPRFQGNEQAYTRAAGQQMRGEQAGAQQPLNLGGIQGPMGMTAQQGSVQPMGMAPPQGGAQPPTMRQTVQQQQFAKQQQGGASGAAAGGAPSATQTAAPKGVNNNLTATANTTPATASTTPPATPTFPDASAAYSPPNYGSGTQFGAGAMTPGVTTDQLQGAVTGSPLLNTGPATAGQISQAQYNPMINMPGQADLMNQFSTPGRSNTMGQYGTGGLANTANQMAANQAAQQGIQGAQGLIAGNVQQQLGSQQIGSQMDMAQRQQQLQHITSMLGPAVSGAASGFNQAIQGMTGMPRFLS